ncbi:hypothetical protein ACFY1P_20760 [Streptomyces sp. NPDC001407]|uniref:hypothetical protein n=1 Tax=Streptomyces sp. NPDC001407 TaxID=3364573 RepID=UPI003689A569
MTPDRSYALARELLDLDADYTVHVRTADGWQQPADPYHRELPGLDVLLAARRVLRARPVGRVWSPRPETLHVRTGDGRAELRFVPKHLAEAQLCGAADCAGSFDDAGRCARCTTASRFAGAVAPAPVWKVLGWADSAVVPISRNDLTTTDLVTLARACHSLSRRAFAGHTLLSPRPRQLLDRLARALDDLDEGRPHTPDIDEVFSRAELLTLAGMALSLYRDHHDPDDVLTRPVVLLVTHLDYADAAD